MFSIADGLDKKRPSKKIKFWQTTFAWRFSWILSKITGKQPLLSKYSARSAHSISKYSSEKLLKAIDFKFSKIDTVIQDVCENFKA